MAAKKSPRTPRAAPRSPKAGTPKTPRSPKAPMSPPRYPPGLGTIRSVLPSLVTLAAFTAGLLAIQHFMQAKQDSTKLADACWYLVCAFALDFFDGALARWLQASSRIGASLDFLTDATAYVVAPGVMLVVLNQAALAALWLACGLYRCSRQEAAGLRDGRARGRFYGLISNHASLELCLALLVLDEKGHATLPSELPALITLLCALMVSPLWFWKITKGPSWWTWTIYPGLCGMLVCAYTRTGAEVLLGLNTLYILLGAMPDAEAVVQVAANLLVGWCGLVAIAQGAPHGIGDTSWWICAAFMIDCCAALVTQAETHQLRLLTGFIAFTIAPLFLFEEYTELSMLLWVLSSGYRRAMGAGHYVDVQASISEHGIPSALCATLLAAAHAAGLKGLVPTAGLAALMVAPVRCIRLDQLARLGGVVAGCAAAIHVAAFHLVVQNRHQEALGVYACVTSVAVFALGAANAAVDNRKGKTR